MLVHVLLGIACLLFIINLICNISTLKIRRFPLGDFLVIFLFSYLSFIFFRPVLELGQDVPAFLKVFAVHTKRSIDDKTAVVGEARDLMQKGVERELKRQMDDVVNEMNGTYGENPFTASKGR